MRFPLFFNSDILSFFGDSGESFLLLFYRVLVEKVPNQQRTLNKVPIELRCRNFVNHHRLSICVYSTMYSNWSSILHTPVGGWVGFLNTSSSSLVDALCTAY